MPETEISDELLSKITGFVAEDSVGPSALRGQVHGTRKATIQFLRGISLSAIPRESQASYTAWLDTQTEMLRKKLPDPLKPWGVARKALNLFLRSCVYNHYLRRAHALDALETLLEVPLDSVVGKKIRQEDADGCLPSWTTLKRLKPSVSERFQAHAAEMARARRLPARVFLDNYFWLDGR